jgi:hypothetical protein
MLTTWDTTKPRSSGRGQSSAFSENVRPVLRVEKNDIVLPAARDMVREDLFIESAVRVNGRYAGTGGQVGRSHIGEQCTFAGSGAAEEPCASGARRPAR